MGAKIRDVYQDHVATPRRIILPPSFQPSNNVCATLQLYYWRFWLSCLQTFCSPIAFIASGCTTMHQQFGSCRLPPISGQIKIFFCLQVNPWRIYSSIVPAVEHVCATCNFHYSFALFPISFSVLFGFCVLNYIFDVATGQDPEMINSATVHRTTIFFVKDSQAKALLHFAPVRSSHWDVFSTSTNTWQFRP